jgi:hypothetical protein
MEVVTLMVAVARMIMVMSTGVVDKLRFEHESSRHHDSDKGSTN